MSNPVEHAPADRSRFESPTRPAAYELAFFFFLVLTTGRLIFGSHVGPFSWQSGLFVALSGGYGLLLFRREAFPWCRLREALTFAGVGIAYFALGPVVECLGSDRIDVHLYAWDRDRLGFDITEVVADLGPVWLTEILSFCYASFYGLLILVALWCAFPSPDLPPWLTQGVLLIFGVGLLGYTTLPASGPYVYLGDQFNDSLDGGPVTNFVDYIVREWGNKVDVFPSLHTAITLFALAGIFYGRPRLGWVLLAPSLGLVVSTVYLRYHYLIDVVVGAVLALGLFAIYWFASRRELERIRA